MSRVRDGAARVLQGLPLVVILVVFWMLLWGELSWLQLLGGILVALGITSVFYLPAVILTDRVNPWRLVVYFARLVYDIAHASVQVAWLALAPRYSASNAVVAVHLCTRNDLITTWVGVSTSIVPGSIVVDIDRAQSILYLHVLNVRSHREAELFSQSVLATERRVVAAVGTSDDVARVQAAADASTHPHRARRGPNASADPAPGPAAAASQDAAEGPAANGGQP